MRDHSVYALHMTWFIMDLFLPGVSKEIWDRTSSYELKQIKEACNFELHSSKEMVILYYYVSNLQKFTSFTICILYNNLQYFLQQVKEIFIEFVDHKLRIIQMRLNIGSTEFWGKGLTKWCDACTYHTFKNNFYSKISTLKSHFRESFKQRAPGTLAAGGWLICFHKCK